MIGEKLEADVRGPLNGATLLDAGTLPWVLYSARQRRVFLTILFAVTTSSYFDYYILSVALEPIKQEFGVSDTLLGMLGGFCFAVLYAVTALPIARWADFGNRRSVITITLTIWSVMTALCGVAHSFWQLALARVGVGMVEPGAAPPSQSLVIDYFPVERRATASAILNAGSAAGYLFGVGMGGYIVATAGWRMAFLVAGLPGLLLAVIVRLFLAEPRERLGFPSADPAAESVGLAFSALKRKRAYLYSLAGLSIYCAFAFGVGIFLPAFMIRTYHATLAEVSVTWGMAIAVASLGGALIGGSLADWLRQRDIRWYAWLPALACAAGAPLYWTALSAEHLWTFIVVDFMAELVLAIGISVCFTSIHAVCGHRRRAMAIALAQLSMTLIGSGFGPVIAGTLSDAFRAQYGVESLRYSLIVMTFFLLPASAAYYCSGAAMPQELED